MIQLFAMDIRPLLEQEERIPELAEPLSAERRKKVFGCPSREKRALSLGAGLCLQAALAAAGLRERDCRYEYGENGKPRISGRPELHFNLSHSHHMAICALSCQSVGADVEYIRAFPEKLPARHFSPAEREYLCSMATEEQRRQAFFQLWTIRESFLKATGRGLVCSLSAFSVHPGEKPRLLQNISERPWLLSQRRLPGYALSLCHLEPDVGEVTFLQP